MKIELYEAMNKKIVDILKLGEEPEQYAAEYIKSLRVENERLKAENAALIKEADDNAALAMEQKLRADRLGEQLKQVREEIAKEIFKSIWESMVFMCRVENTPAEEQCENLINQFDKIIINLAKEYGVEIEE